MLNYVINEVINEVFYKVVIIDLYSKQIELFNKWVYHSPNAIKNRRRKKFFVVNLLKFFSDATDQLSWKPYNVWGLCETHTISFCFFTTTSLDGIKLSAKNFTLILPPFWSTFRKLAKLPTCDLDSFLSILACWLYPPAQCARCVKLLWTTLNRCLQFQDTVKPFLYILFSIFPKKWSKKTQESLFIKYYNWHTFSESNRKYMFVSTFNRIHF